MIRNKLMYIGFIILLLCTACGGGGKLYSGVYELSGLDTGFLKLEPVNETSGNFQYYILYSRKSASQNAGEETNQKASGVYTINEKMLSLAEKEYRILDTRTFLNDAETWIWMPEQPLNTNELFAN